MKVFNLFIALSLLSAQLVFAQERVDGIESAQSVLNRQYAELADLKENVENANAVKKTGWIAVAVSSAAIGAGIFGLTERALLAVGKKAVTFSSTKRWSTGESYTATLGLDDVLVIGGAIGATGSATVIAVEAGYGLYLSNAIAKQMEKIAATQALLLKN